MNLGRRRLQLLNIWESQPFLHERGNLHLSSGVHQDTKLSHLHAKCVAMDPFKAHLPFPTYAENATCKLHNRADDTTSCTDQASHVRQSENIAQPLHSREKMRHRYKHAQLNVNVACEARRPDARSYLSLHRPLPVDIGGAHSPPCKAPQDRTALLRARKSNMWRFSCEVMRMMIDTSAAAACRAAMHPSHGQCRGEAESALLLLPPRPRCLLQTDGKTCHNCQPQDGCDKRPAAGLATHACHSRPARPALPPKPPWPCTAPPWAGAVWYGVH